MNKNLISTIKTYLLTLTVIILCSCQNPQNFDGVTPPVLPDGWSSTGVEGQQWITVASSNPDRPADTEPNSAFVPSFNNQDVSLLSPIIFLGDGGTSEISFKHRCKTENAFDGMVLEAIVNGGAAVDISTIGTFLEGPYSNIIPLLGFSKAWTGESNYVLTRIALPNFAANTNLRFKFRSISDNTTSAVGCSLDSLNFKGADLSVSLVESKDPILVDEEITYTISVKNLGPLLAENVKLTDILPANFVLSSVSLSQGVFTVSTAPVLSANLGNLAVNETANMTVKGKVTSPPAKAAILQFSQTDFSRTITAAAPHLVHLSQLRARKRL